MNFWAFMGASFVGRGLRFFIVSSVLMIFGEKIKDHIEFVIVGATIVIIAFFYLLYKKRNALSKIDASRTILQERMANMDAAEHAEAKVSVK